LARSTWSPVSVCFQRLFLHWYLRTRKRHSSRRSASACCSYMPPQVDALQSSCFSPGFSSAIYL